MKVKRSTIIFLIICIIGFVGCTPYIYKEEVGKFDQGVNEASETFELQRKILAETALTINREDLFDDNNPRLVISDQCLEMMQCLGKSAFRLPRAVPCVGKFLNSNRKESTTTEEKLDEYDRLLNLAAKSCKIETIRGKDVEIPTQATTQRRVLDGLKSYANALAGIVDASDRDSLNTSASSACGSAQTLFVTASSLKTGGEDVDDTEDARRKKEATAVGETCGFLTEIGTGFLDHQRMRVLTRVVNDANPKVKILADYLKIESRKPYNIILRHELEKLTDSVEKTVGFEDKGKNNIYLASIENAVAQKEMFLALLKDNPERVFAQMAVAHTKLKDAVNDPKPQLESAIASIESFYNSAKKAHDAVKALSEKNVNE